MTMFLRAFYDYRVLHLHQERDRIWHAPAEQIYRRMIILLMAFAISLDSLETVLIRPQSNR